MRKWQFNIIRPFFQSTILILPLFILINIITKIMLFETKLVLFPRYNYIMLITNIIFLQKEMHDVVYSHGIQIIVHSADTYILINIDIIII